MKMKNTRVQEMKNVLTLVIVLFSITIMHAQLTSQQKKYTHADTLRGSITPERGWWDLLHYDLHVTLHHTDSTVTGFNVIRYQVKKSSQKMQIDLMQPLGIDSIIQNGVKQKFVRDGNAFFVQLASSQPENSVQTVSVYYHGKPQVAARPPWDGGVVWAKDKKGRPWITVACQGLGASVWFPCKDHQADEPDSAAMSITTLATDSLVAVANGHLKSVLRLSDGVTYTWVVRNPINNYSLIPYIGHYVSFEETYAGEKGPLATSYWVLDYNLDKAKTHLRDAVLKTLKNLEYWFGPYPFYEDGYKIVDAPHLGMEHQSAIAYGNGYQFGYRGRDLSASGWGLKWDFIVVHESAHEWFGNNITTNELADMWVHESFANYSETLYTTSEFGKEAGNDYVIGTRKNIQNDVPIIGKYNVNEEGSGDMYYKGGNMLHMIRLIIGDDEKFRQILRGLNKDFYHTTVTTAQIENYISLKAGIDFSKVFDQYLRTTQIPTLSYGTKVEPGYLTYSWTNCVEGFDMPVRVSLKEGEFFWLKPTTKRKKVKITSAPLPPKIVDRNFYVKEERQLDSR